MPVESLFPPPFLISLYVCVRACVRACVSYPFLLLLLLLLLCFFCFVFVLFLAFDDLPFSGFLMQFLLFFACFGNTCGFSFSFSFCCMHLYLIEPAVYCFGF